MGPGCGRGTTIALPSPRPSRERQPGGSGQTTALGSPWEHQSKAAPTAPHPPAAPQPLLGYTWCFNKCFLFDFLIFVFSEKALASSNSFLRVAERKQLGESRTPKPFPKLPQAMGRRQPGPAVRESPMPHGNTSGLPGNTRATQGCQARRAGPCNQQGHVGPWWEVLMFLPFHWDFPDLPYPQPTHVSPVSQLAAARLKLPKDLALFCDGRSRL